MVRHLFHPWCDSCRVWTNMCFICVQLWGLSRMHLIFTYLWLESWPWACSAPVWPPCSSAAAWSGSRAPSGSCAPQPGTCLPGFYRGRRPKCVRRSPGPADAPWRRRTARRRVGTRGGTCGRVRSRWDRLWLFGLEGGIWPGDSANSPPAARHMPPNLETDTERFGIQEHLFYIVWGEHLVCRCWIRTKARAAYPQMISLLKFIGRLL